MEQAASLPFMKKGGSIVNIASMYGIVSPYLAVYEPPCEASLIPVNYSAGKAAVIQMTRYFGTYLIDRKIRVNSISPGPFPSPKVQEASATFLCSSTQAAASESTFLLSGPEKDFLTGRPLRSLPA